ncbi:MAG: outer membrane beta-barrel protein [Chthoniobacterales bacterium]
MAILRSRRLSRARISVLICSASFSLFSSTLRSQTADVDRAQLLRTQADTRTDSSTSPEGGEEEYGGSPNDPDLGKQQILRRQERYQPFTFSVGAPFYYTSNAALTRGNEQGDFLVAPQASFTYQPRLAQALYAFVSVQQQMFYYERFSDLNFGSFDARAGLVYYLPRLHDLTLRAGYEYNRLTFENSIEDEFFSNHSFFFSAEVPFRFGKAIQLSVGFDANVSVSADPEPPRRNDYDVFVGFDAQLTRELSFDAVARLAVRDYSVGDRTDVGEMLALSLNYRLTKWITLSAISTFAANQSDQSAFDYTVVNVGGALAFTWRF